MCGIVAMVMAEPGISSDIISGMVAALRHRGPDSQGVHRFRRCTLGNARLSIIDVEGGRQPILSRDGALGVTFNGAIYGFRELKTHLADYPFKTGTDTEVILALYAKHGDRLLSHLPGMFAFALWDDRRETLICARDRFGEKPLYYAFGPAGEFLVASEIKAIIASGLVEPVLNLEAVSHYLKRVHLHPSHTIYTNVHVLPPAHVLRFENGHLKVERYWQPPDVQESIAMEEAVERFRHLFEAAIEKQLVADVPVGVLLSGGVDSSTVAAVASQRQPGVHTFSFGFREGVENELPFARGIAERYQTSHFELVDYNVDIPALLLRMQTIYDEPFGDSSSIPTFLICELARRHVAVALGGDAADELLGGYVFWTRQFLDAPPSEVVPRSSPSESKSLMQRLARWLSRRQQAEQPPAGSPLVRRYSDGFRNYFTIEEQHRLGISVESNHLMDYSRYQRNTVDDMLRFDTDLYLPGDILVKTDRASMANSLELRAPFLDVDLASFCLSLPDILKVDADREKLLLRQAYQPMWTPEIRGRSKQGFGGPMAVWLQTPAMSVMKRDVLGDRRQRIFSVLDFDGVQTFVERNTQQTWSLLVLAIWMEEHLCSLPAKS
jgi:asparagine synthase (glutamine-hydrolysing)